MNNVPKVLHLFWGKNKPLSYLRYLTVKSFVKYNPDWGIRVHIPTSPIDSKPRLWPTEITSSKFDYFDKLNDIPNVDFIPVESTKEIGSVHTSDLLRIKLLHEEGGVGYRT